MDNNDIRRDILRLLHALHDESRTDLIECARLADRLKIPASRVAGNIQYLKDKQYIEVVIHKHGSRRFEYAKITSAGMDLVKNPAELNGTFPPQEVHYHYHGDYFNVKVGDHATNVVIGKDIYQLNVGSLHPLGEVVGRLMEQVSAQGDLAQPAIVEVENRLKEMLNIVREPELDLGALP